MSYLAGKIVLAVTAGAPNNGAGSGTTAPVKKATVRGRTYPYVSAQAFRRWVRETMVLRGVVPSPTTRVGKAEGKAQSVLVRAKAECEVNRMLQSTLSAILIQIKTIEKWNGDPATGHRWLHAAPRPE